MLLLGLLLGLLLLSCGCCGRGSLLLSLLLLGLLLLLLLLYDMVRGVVGVLQGRWTPAANTCLANTGGVLVHGSTGCVH